VDASQSKRPRGCPQGADGPDTGSQALLDGPAVSALDLHGAISYPDGSGPSGERLTYCRRAKRLYPKLRLATTGRLVPMRCKAANRCDYCARLAAVEFAEVLALDALEDGNAPRVWIVLTTRDATTEPAAFYDARRAVQKAIRRRFPAAEFCWVVEFTTGYGSRSGGARRPHWNVLVKNVDPADVAEVETIVRWVWCARDDVDAEPAAQFVGAVSEVGGLMRYLALHFLKESQRPPKGWRGHRTTQTRGYFALPMWKMRARAKTSLAFKRALWRAARDGIDPAAAQVVAEHEVFRAEQRAWECVVVSVDDATGELLRARPLHGGDVEHVMRSDEVHARRFNRAQDAARAPGEPTALRASASASSSDDASAEAGNEPPCRDADRSTRVQAPLPTSGASWSWYSLADPARHA